MGKHTPEHRAFLRRRLLDDNPAPTRACQTPLGEFDSLTLAAKAHGVSRQAVQQRIARNSEGWEYA